MGISRNKLENLKNDIEDLLNLMEEKHIDKLPARSNTYGLYGDFISFAGVGFISIEDTIDDIWEGKLEDEDEEDEY